MPRPYPPEFRFQAVALVRAGNPITTAALHKTKAQTVTVARTTAAEIVLPRLTDSLKAILQQRKSIGDDVKRMLDAHPLSLVLTSMPGVGVTTGGRILLEVGDGSAPHPTKAACGEESNIAVGK